MINGRLVRQGNGCVAMLHAVARCGRPNDFLATLYKSLAVRRTGALDRLVREKNSSPWMALVMWRAWAQTHAGADTTMQGDALVDDEGSDISTSDDAYNERDGDLHGSDDGRQMVMRAP